MKIPETSRVKFSVGRLAAGLVLIASIAGAGFASAAERNLGTRPTGVPADYVILRSATFRLRAFSRFIVGTRSRKMEEFSVSQVR